MKTKSDESALGILPEDLALDRELDRLNQIQEPTFSDNGHVAELKKEREHKELLSQYLEDYEPAATLMALEEQVLNCADLGADSIEVSPQIMRKYCGANYKDAYFVFKGIKCYPAGTGVESKRVEVKHVDEVLFPKKESAKK